MLSITITSKQTISFITLHKTQQKFLLIVIKYNFKFL